MRLRATIAVLLLAAPLAIGLCLEATPEKATLLGWEGPSCLVADHLGEAACPGCGLTRSTALWVQGDFAGSTAAHPVGWLVVLLCAAGIALYTDIFRRGQTTSLHRRLLRSGRWAFASGIVAAWVLRLAGVGG